MADRTGTEHDLIIMMLPDYAVGDLGDGDLWRVADHHAICDICQRELSFLLETISLIAPAPQPARSVRRAVVGTLQTEPGVAPAPISGAQVSGTGRRFPFVPLTLIAAALIIVASLGAWRIVLDQDESQQNAIAQLLLDPEAAHPINDSEVDVGAGGAMFTDRESSVAYLVASGLPAPGPDQVYQIWLFTQDGQRISAGTVDVEPDGIGQAVVRAPQAFSAYWAVGVSLEPRSGSDAPTSPLVVGGWLQ